MTILSSLRAARLIPAVEYLPSQRARMFMMMTLAGEGVPAQDPPPYSPLRNASNMTDYACHPAVAVPNGFNDNGLPTSMTFYAHPFRESELLAVAMAY